MLHLPRLLAGLCLAINVAAAGEPARPDPVALKPPAAMAPRPGSVLDPPADTAGYRFAMAAEPRPAGWSLLLGALLSGGFSVRRRLAVRPV
ncbi:MAG TPA: hypothetical protein VF096_16735 [Azonexus sp.]